MDCPIKSGNHEGDSGRTFFHLSPVGEIANKVSG